MNYTDEKRYRQLLENVKERDLNRCAKCKSTYRLEVHHIKPRLSNPELLFDEDNCITLCRRCHRKETMRFQKFRDTIEYRETLEII